MIRSLSLVHGAPIVGGHGGEDNVDATDWPEQEFKSWLTDLYIMIYDCRH